MSTKSEQPATVTLYIVQRVSLWTDIKTNHPGVPPLQGAQGLGMGFLPVFESREEAEAFAPGALIAEATFVRPATLLGEESG